MKVYLDKSCLVCGKTWTRLGFICEDDYRTRYGTIHPRWNAPVYHQAMYDEMVAMDKRNAEQLASRKRTAEQRAA